MLWVQSSNNSNSASPTINPLDYKREKACFMVLTKNEQLNPLIATIKNYEEHFNKNYRYPWYIFNDQPFDSQFVDVLSKEFPATEYHLLTIPKSYWSYPDWIDLNKADETRREMDRQNVIYGESESYRHMCRYWAGYFFRHTELKNFDWFWRVEPGTNLLCDINYDIFKYMNYNGKKYGFVISIHEIPNTIETLWESVKKYISINSQTLSPNNLQNFITDKKADYYNLCHFWSNFEIGSLNFFRSETYVNFFEFLDKEGGIYYERWGDAPIHSIALSLFLNKTEIHFFDDIGYYHEPFTHCPLDKAVWKKNKCSCNRRVDFTFQDFSCGVEYYDAQEIIKPASWKFFRQYQL
ncbi:related to Alpha-1,2 mannosyltransferase KTR1 [Saccharomycodes ludwigii]|uniref:Related to Alpha-1,2 mannosyltransferase KTR1 n=1 Tax=Saccharomycodes ludwigii TaxID=36035 RepID=A0A376B9S5_9ASCO|nr:hypothetical protein SCDLUD_001977 [Saccharomycodes ludwigii]KAH3902163.1 hypothetical protein SCDLUD_001977 [Saccharomycodes ludwigii]SSD61426.1 related to Alpha-1,2 mannosyltransferase KTR1 [Saccharomycodes ludwigii]